MLSRMRSNRNSHTLPVGMKNMTDTLEDSLLFSYKIKHSLTIPASNYATWGLPEGAKIFCPHEKKNLPVRVAQWIECQPKNQKVTGSIFGWGTFLGCRPGPQ